MKFTTTNAQLRPNAIIKNITIDRYGEDSKKWDSVLAFKKFNSQGEIRKVSFWYPR